MKSKLLKKKYHHSRMTLGALVTSSVVIGLLAVSASYASTPSLVQNVSDAPKGLPPEISGSYTPLASSTQGDGSGICYYSSCYYYAGAAQSQITSTGASVNFSLAKPRLGSGDSHSLIELAVQSSDRRQIVEVGWVVAPSLNHDLEPHLFVYHWVNGATSCYNGCGFVGLHTPVPAGAKLKAGIRANFKIEYAANNWNIYYNGNRIGYYPESLWGGKYTTAGIVQVFGEVAARTNGVPTSQMGNGYIASDTRSAYVDHFNLLGSKSAAKLSTYQISNPRSYSIGLTSAALFHLGGPGGF